MGHVDASKLRDYLKYGATTLSVNLPNLALQAVPGSDRITHLHRNVPGVMARMNQILAEHGVNIDGQLLATERSEEHTSELQSRGHLVCRLLLAKKKRTHTTL